MIIKAVIFDLVGTLINSPTKKEYSEYIMAISELLNVSAERLRVTWSEDQERRFKGIDINFTKYIHHVCDRIGITYPGNAAFEKFYQQASILFRWMKPRADASATLKQIKKSGLMLGLISDAAYEVPRLWEKHSLSRFFDVTIFSNKVHLKKPDPKIYLLACERLDVKPTECLYVGDGGSWELTGAEKVGMTSLQISSPEDDDS